MHEEFSFGVNSLGRFHVMLYRQRGSLAMVVRRISPTIPSLVDLGIEACEDMLGQPGVILVAGGRKRRDAMAGLIDRFNASHRASVVTIEHPLTILHRDAMAAIAQREVGVDVESFAVGIHSAIRQQADLLAVSDVSDRATAEGIVSAAENGLQVIACVSAPSSKLARSWILRLFASETDTNIGERLERVLTGICCVPDSGSSSIDRM